VGSIERASTISLMDAWARLLDAKEDGLMKRGQLERALW
jgi:hypothetical protein